MSEARLQRLKQDIEDAPRRAPVAVVEDMSWEEFSRVNVRAPELPGVTAEMGEVRVYPVRGGLLPRGRLCRQGQRQGREQDQAERPADPAQSGLPHRQARHREGVRPAACAARPARGRSRSTSRAAWCERHPGGDLPAARRRDPADARRRHPEPGAGGVRRRLRRGGDDGCPQRRRALPVVGAELRRQPVRQGHDRPGLPRPGRVRPQAAVRQGAQRDLSARLDLQDHGGDGGAGERRRPGADVHLQRRDQLRRPGVPLRQAPRHAGHAQRDQDLVRRVLL